MKIRVISDLHIDHNLSFDIDWKQKKDEIVVIAGDISGDLNITKKYLSSHFKEVIFVEGNHILYNNKSVPLDDLYNSYKKAFSKGNKHFLENSYYIKDDIVFVGCTLWTNYTLDGDQQKAIKDALANPYINDFRWGLVKEGKKIRHLTPSDMAKKFDESVKFIEQTCIKFPNKKIVVVTHYGPSRQSVIGYKIPEEAYPDFATNLEPLIKRHSNIKVWIHGHTHRCCQYKIGDTKVYCNSWGFAWNNEVKDFNPFLTIEV